MRLVVSMAIGAVLGLIVVLIVNSVITIPLAPVVGLFLGALAAWVYRPGSRL
jgi:hypothetical protein